ncbi:MAG: MFS transporter [Ruminiclostridium sp.]|nr:MFS transporter [Ruminiclostridium sp.]
MENRVKKILAASYVGYITQAIVNNLAPLLFLIFSREFEVTLEKITLIITMNFGVQLAVDLAASKLVNKIGYKQMIVAAHVFAALGLAGMGLLTLLPMPYTWLLVSSVIYAVGGGLIEVMISPIVEACPTDSKSGAMSLLHSFYCWGQVFTVVMSTVFLSVFGEEKWRILAVLWALIPLANAFFFSTLKLYQLQPTGSEIKLRVLFNIKLFWLFLAMMMCAGASELAMSQWASAYAQKALGVSLEIGNLAGPCLFALLMGTARAIYAKSSDKINLLSAMIGCCSLCIVGYLLAGLSPLPALGFAGCGLVGFSVGIMWPGIFSLAGEKCPQGGTAMFAMLALAGDLGCTGGPTATGFISGANSGELKSGLLFAVVFPLILGIVSVCFKLSGKKSSVPKH